MALWMGPDSRYEWFYLTTAWWLWIKIVIVLMMSAMHGLFGRWVKAFAAEFQPAFSEIL